MVAMCGGFPQTYMLGARSKTVNRMRTGRFDFATALHRDSNAGGALVSLVREALSGPAALPRAARCAEMFEHTGGYEGKAGFEWKRAGRKRFRGSKRNCCGKFRRWTNCCSSRG